MAEVDLKGVATGGGGGGGNSTIINTAANPVIIRPLTCSDLITLCASGVPIDPRIIRFLAFATDKVDVSGSTISLTGGTIDVSDRCARLLGQLCVAGIAIDPRVIRFLAFATDKVDVSGSTVTIGAITSITQFTPIQKALQHNVALPAAGADILGASLAPTNTPCSFRISIAVSITGQLTLDRINGGVEVKTFLNGGSALSESVEYTFDIQVFTGDTINLEYSVTGGTVMILRIAEIDAAVSQ